MPQATLTLPRTSFVHPNKIIHMYMYVLVLKIMNQFVCVSRHHAVWDYILELSTEKYTSEMALQILSILDKICRSAQKQMSHTVTKIVRRFQQSVFFISFLPDFVKNLTEESYIR